MKQNELNELYQGFDHFFPEGAAPNNEPFGRWQNRQSFAEEIKNFTKIDISSGNPKAIKDSQQALEGLVVTTSKLESERPSTQQLETFGEEAAKRLASKEASAQKAKDEVDNLLSKQKEIQETLKAKRVYAKVEAPQKSPLKNPEQIEILKKQAAVSPKSFEEDLYPKVKSAIEPALKDKLSAEEIDFQAKKIAYDTAKGLADPSAQENLNIQSAVLEKVGAYTPEVADAAEAIGYSQNNLVSRNIIASINSDLAQEAFGPSPSDYQVTFLNESVPGAYPVDVSQIGQGYTQLLQNQSTFLSNVGSLGQEKAQSFLMGQARTWLDGQVANMSPEIAGIYDSAAVQNALQFMGFGEPVAFSESWFGEAVLKIPGASPFFEGLGIGGGFGAGAAASATTATAASVTTTGGIMAGEAFLGGAATAAAVGQAAIPVPIVGAAIGAVAGVVAPKIGNVVKNNARTYGKFIIAGAGAVFGAVIGASAGIGFLLGGLIGGFGSYGLATVFTGGLPALGSAAASFGSGMGAFFGALGSATLGAIGAPILATLLGLPVVIAVILFIINSGAYVVPPAPVITTGTENPYIDVTKVASPTGPFENSALPLKINYTITITAKKEDLTNASFTNECSVTTKSGSQKCTAPTVVIPNGIVPVGKPFTFTYEANYNSSYKDSFVTDTVTVSAKVTSQGRMQTADSSVSVKIGAPPEECPSLWPTNHGRVTQGAYTNSSHSTLEAIDIGVSHVGVLATHTGTVVHAQTDSCYGNNIEIKSTCAGKVFVSRYAHLEGMKVKVGQTVTAGKQIGLSGNTTGGKPSCSTGDHLHYDFDYWPGIIPTKYPNNPPYMMNPYIPQNVKRGCVDNCNVSW
jgi:murein DD-endopeptidase MepM/ murein hydrolase activator NlpD